MSHSGASSLLAHDIFQEVLPYMNVFQSNTSVDDGSPIVDEAATPVQGGEEPESGTSEENSTSENGTPNETEPGDDEETPEGNSQEPAQE